MKGFLTVHAEDVEWQDDHDLLALGEGVQVKVLHEDREAGLIDMLVKFPAGYVEPEHAHDSCHSICVLEGVQIVGGEHMRPGDYVWADANVVHGPYEYPEGCVVFVSFWGSSAAHRYPGSVAGGIRPEESRP
jgi:quercetin dioxygenase-like cupin family protein